MQHFGTREAGLMVRWSTNCHLLLLLSERVDVLAFLFDSSMAGQAVVDERHLKLCENEIDSTQKSNLEARDDRRAMSNMKSNESNEAHKEGNTGSCSQRIVANNTKQRITVEGMLGLKEGAEWSDAEEADILQQAISLCSKKIRKGGKSITTKQAPTKPVDEAALRPDSCNSTHELNEEVSTGITVRQRITPVVSIEGDEIVLRIPVRVEQRVGHLEHQLKQPSQEANCERDAIKKVTSRRNRISRIKHDKSSNCFTDDGGGIPVSKGEPHKRLCRIHGKGVKVIHSKQHRRSKSAPYKLSAAAVNKDQLGENKVRKGRHFSKRRKMLSASSEGLNGMSRSHSCECVEGSLADEHRSRPSRYTEYNGQGRRFQCVQHPPSKVRIPINVVPRRRAQKSCHVHRVLRNHERVAR
uniref:Uncharacterized protein n=1 Tax=Parascaris univalens TaxID=6257 RepID=A0A915B1Z0_PARUN